MLRVKDPAQIPRYKPPLFVRRLIMAGGIRFELIQPPFETGNASYICINSVPLPFTAIFSSYERVFAGLTTYLVSDVLVGLLTGKPIREIYRRSVSY